MVKKLLAIITLALGILFISTIFANGGIIQAPLIPQNEANAVPVNNNQSTVNQEVRRITQQRAPATTVRVAPVAIQQITPGPQSPHEEAFTGVAREALPMTPQQIRLLRQLFDETQRAAAAEPGVPSRPTTSAIEVNISPGATPPIIRLKTGFVTALVFVDGTGAPWPIRAYDVGDPQSFDIQWDKESNILLVQARTAHKRGNIAVLLRDLNTPVMLTFLPSQRAYDALAEIRVPGIGPNATVIQEGLPAGVNPALLDVLNSIPPPTSKELRIIGCGIECHAWHFNDRLYLRTRMTVISPGWTAIMSSADGMHAYELPPTPVVLALSHGKTLKLIIKDPDNDG